MLRLPAIALSTLLASTVSSQQFEVADLLHQDWQHRNAAALALHRADVDIGRLRDVLRTEWHGQLPEYRRMTGLGGSYAARIVEPRTRVLRDARKVIGYQGSLLFRQTELADAADLVVPWHPHELACWLLLQRPTNDTTQAPEPTSIEHARAWLHLAAPDDEAIAAAASTTGVANDIAVALWLQGDRGRATLRRLLPLAHPTLANSILRLSKLELFDDAARLAVVAGRFLNGVRQADRRHAGYLLRELGRRGAAALAAFPIDQRHQRTYACQLLAVLGADAAPAAALLADSIDAGMKGRRAALVALASIEIPAQLQATVAARSLAAFHDRELMTKLLALDALGNCGDGVDERQRDELAALLHEPKRDTIKPRLLGCLHALGIPSGLTTRQKADLAEGDTPSTDTWLALADDGIPAAKLLRPMLPNMPIAVDRSAVCRHLAETAPHVVRQWVDAKDVAVQAAAIAALRACGRDDDVPTARLVELLSTDARLADRCLEWLTERDDAAGFAPTVFAHVVERSRSWVPRAGQTFLARVELPAIQKLTLLAPLLRTGKGWAAVRDCAPDVLRQECRRWIDATESPAVRDTLVGELCRAGLATDADVELVVETLAGRNREDTLTGLAHAPSLPEPVRKALIAVLFEEVDDDFYVDDWHAREALLAHRQR